MHYKERVPVDEICKAFVQAHPGQLFQASLFDDCRSSNSCNRNLINTTQFYVVFCACQGQGEIEPAIYFSQDLALMAGR